MDFVTRLIVGVGLSFELPVVMALTAKLGLVRAKQFLGFWRYAIIVIFVIAAIVTPTPDPYNQTLVGGPLLLLYFLGVGFAWALQPRRKKAESADAS
jgi:sec-independent protein translocase protein TatC